MATIINNSTGGRQTLFSEEHIRQPYTHWGCVVRHVWNEGLTAIPIAEAPTAPYGGTNRCSVVRLSAPHGTMTVTWGAKRLGAMPELPHPISQNGNHRFVHSVMQFENPDFTVEGATPLFSASGVYHYILERPLWIPAAGSWMGWTAYVAIPPNVLVVPASQFKNVIQ